MNWDPNYFEEQIDAWVVSFKKMLASIKCWKLQNSIIEKNADPMEERITYFSWIGELYISHCKRLVVEVWARKQDEDFPYNINDKLNNPIIKIVNSKNIIVECCDITIIFEFKHLSEEE